MGAVAGGSRIKGVAFREFLVWLEAQRGTAFLLGVAERMPPELRALLDPRRPALGTLPSTWYDAKLVHALLDGISAKISPAERSTLARDASRAVMSNTLSGIYQKLMSMFVTPAIYARFANKLWQSYYEGGEFVVKIAADGRRADCTVKDWGAHHPLMCAMNTEAATAIYVAMGRKSVSTTRIACVGDGAPLCHFVTTWGE